jgi:hypothetical protein
MSPSVLILDVDLAIESRIAELRTAESRTRCVGSELHLRMRWHNHLESKSQNRRTILEIATNGFLDDWG